MFKYVCRWAWSHRKTTLGLFLLVSFVLLNVLAYLHAHAMTCFAATGKGTARPEELTALQKATVLLTGVKVTRPSGSGITPDSAALPFEVQRIQGEGGVELEGWYIPCREAHGLIVMFHGYAACKESLLTEAKGFHELGYALLLVDFRCSGGSNGNITTVGYLEAEDVAFAANYAHSHWGHLPQFLYGKSMGAAAVLRALAVQGVPAQAAILECPFDTMLNTVANRFDSMGVPAFPAAQLLVFWGGVQHGFNGFRHNPVDYAGHVECPVLMIHGAQDIRVSKSQAETVYQALKGPKELEMFADAGHESFLKLHPERWQKTVRSFLTRYEDTAAP